MLTGELIPAGELAEVDKTRRWLEASELFLNSRNSENTRSAYRQALVDLLDHSKKSPWAIERADVQRWVEDMRQRGLSASTIRLRVSAISSFYAFCQDEFALVSSNPAGGKSLRPAASPYGKAAWLSIEDVRALLAAIPQDNLQGLQDYALFLMYLATSRRNSEVRRLQWGDIVKKGDQVMYHWSGKRKERWDEMPEAAYNAILHYLFASGRMPLDETDYIFCPLTDRAVNLPTVPEEGWTRNRPLSIREVNRRLKYYARKAGLRAEKLRVHTLRHTAAMLRKSAGAGLEDISELLNHSSLAITQIYLHKISGRRDETWAKVQEMLGV
jgi:site-specific recombinase XerD